MDRVTVWVGVRIMVRVRVRVMVRVLIKCLSLVGTPLIWCP